MVSRLRFVLGVMMCLVLVSLTACQSAGQISADAGPDQQIQVGDSPIFDGCSSEGSISGYTWTIIEPPDSRPEDINKVLKQDESSCDFTLDAEMGLNDVGTWIIELEVRDADGMSSTDTVNFTVSE
jgi:hypothetical protein